MEEIANVGQGPTNPVYTIRTFVPPCIVGTDDIFNGVGGELESS